MKDSVYRAPKGTRDLVWPDSERRRSFIDLFAGIVSSAGYAEIVLPMFEHIEVFQRLGAVSYTHLTLPTILRV